MKKYFLICLTVFYGTILTALVSQAERDALIGLYSNTDGPNWVDNTNWNTTSPFQLGTGLP